MSTMPPISSSRSAPVTVTSSPASCICTSQTRRSCFGASRVARSLVRGATVFSIGGLLLLILFEIPQVRRRLVLFGGHQVTVPAQEIALPADFHITIALGTHLLDPLRLFDRHPGIFLDHRPWPRERMVERRDLVIEDVWVGFVGVKPLLENALVIGMERKAGRVIRSGTFQPTSLDLEHVVATIPVRVDPSAN